MFCMNYLFVGFIVQKLSSTLSVWKSTYFIGHILIMMPILVLDVAGYGKNIQRLAKSEKDK